MTSARPQSPRSARWGASTFTFGPLGFRSSEYERERPEELRALLFPDSLRLVRERKAAAERSRDKVKRPWLAAQLKHYGIEGQKTDRTVSALRQMLESAIESGRCNTVPQHIQHIESALRESWTLIAHDYSEKLKKYTNDERCRKGREMSQLGSLTAQAEFDTELFLRRYFLDDDGKPDRSKTPKPIALPGYSNRAHMHHVIRKLRAGLESVSGGSGEDRTICIGWDLQGVWNLAHQIGEWSADRQAAMRRQRLRQLETVHERYVASKAGSDPAKSKPALSNLTGSYMIKCDVITSQWDYEELFLDIVESHNQLGVAAAFDFGVLEGVMLLSMSKSDLDRYVCENQADEDLEVEDLDDESDGEDQAENSHEYASLPGKRKHAVPGYGEPRNKKTKVDDTASRKVYLQWRGRETGQGIIEIDRDGSNCGVVEFDSTWTSFTGTWSAGLIGCNISITGLKVADEPKQHPELWSDFSESAYEASYIGRWR